MREVLCEFDYDFLREEDLTDDERHEIIEQEVDKLLTDPASADWDSITVEPIIDKIFHHPDALIYHVLVVGEFKVPKP